MAIRKAKRGQAVARKRHMQLFGSADNNNHNISSHNIGSSSGIGGGGKLADNDNPYSRDGNHVKEAIQLAQSIVRLCSTTFNTTATAAAAADKSTLMIMQQQQEQQQLATALDRLCILLTPDDSDINPSSQRLMNMNPRDYNIATANNGSITGKDFFDDAIERKLQVYDSSMAGMAANAILSQFITVSGGDIGNGGGGNDGGGNESNNLAVALANSLGCILSMQQGTLNNSNNNMSSSNSLQIKSVIVLNQLAATDPPPPQQSASS